MPRSCPAADGAVTRRGRLASAIGAPPPTCAMHKVVSYTRRPWSNIALERTALSHDLQPKSHTKAALNQLCAILSSSPLLIKPAEMRDLVSSNSDLSIRFMTTLPSDRARQA